MSNSYKIPDYEGEVIFGIITKCGNIHTLHGSNSKTHIELFGANAIKGCDRFRVIEDAIYITYRADRTRESINSILAESYPEKKVKEYKILIMKIVDLERREELERICKEKGVGHYLASIISGGHFGD